MKKLIFILFLLLFVTGCNIEYNLVIDRNDFNEKIFIYQTNEYIENRFNTRNIESMITNLVDSNIKMLDPYGLYDYELVLGEEISGVRLIKRESDFETLKNSIVFEECFKNGNVRETSDRIFISAVNGFGCVDYFDNDSQITATIESNRNTSVNNADSINNGVYTWNVDPMDRNYELIYTINKREGALSAVSSDSYIWTIAIIFGAILVIGLPIGVYIYKRYKELNEI